MKYTEVILMLIEFRFKNYRSFRDEAVLSMEATGLSSFKKLFDSVYPQNPSCFPLLRFTAKTVEVKVM